MFLRQSRLVLPAILAVLALVGCGGDNPAGSSSEGIELQGVILEASSGVSAQSVGAPVQSASPSKITVTVAEVPSISAKVSGNGTFVLKNLPAGDFTLVFTRDGTVLGTIPISVVAGTTVIKVVVQADETSVVLVSIDFVGGSGDAGDSDGDNPNKACMIEGGKVGQRIELEGNVASGSAAAFRMRVNGNRVKPTGGGDGLVDVNAAAASFKCNGKPSTSDCKLQLVEGAKIHVRGTLTACTTSAASVTATEVKVQK